MYDIRFEDTLTNEGKYLFIENNRIHFESEEEAHRFLITLLKETGRIGY